MLRKDRKPTNLELIDKALEETEKLIEEIESNIACQTGYLDRMVSLRTLLHQRKLKIIMRKKD